MTHGIGTRGSPFLRVPTISFLWAIVLSASSCAGRSCELTTKCSSGHFNALKQIRKLHLTDATIRHSHYEHHHKQHPGYYSTAAGHAPSTGYDSGIKHNG